jgi:hypothetical protein
MLFARPAFQGNNPDYHCARWNTKKNTITLKQPNAQMNDENSVTAGTVPVRGKSREYRKSLG